MTILKGSGVASPMPPQQKQQLTCQLHAGHGETQHRHVPASRLAPPALVGSFPSVASSCANEEQAPHRWLQSFSMFLVGKGLHTLKEVENLKSKHLIDLFSMDPGLRIDPVRGNKNHLIHQKKHCDWITCGLLSKGGLSKPPRLRHAPTGPKRPATGPKSR